MTTALSSSTKDYLSIGCSDSMRPSGRTHKGECASEKEYWEVFVRICELEGDDIVKIYGLHYTSMSRLSMLGLKQDGDKILVEAGMCPGKAHMIHLFATYVLHSKYHRTAISKDLSFDQVLEFNFLLAHPKEFQPQPSDTDSIQSKTSTSSKASRASAGSRASRTSVGSKSSRNSRRRSRRRSNNDIPRIPRKRPEFVPPLSLDCSSGDSDMDHRSVCSKSSLRSIRSGASKKSVSWNLRCSYSTIPSIEEEDCTDSTSSETSFEHQRSSASSLPQPPTSSVLRAPRRASMETEQGSQSRWSATTQQRSASDDSSALRRLRRPARQASNQALELDLSNDAHEKFGVNRSATNTPITARAPMPPRPDTPTTPTTTTTATTNTSNSPGEIMLAIPDRLMSSSHAPPTDAAARSSLRWAQALDVDEDLTDSDFDYSDDEDDEEDCTSVGSVEEGQEEDEEGQEEDTEEEKKAAQHHAQAKTWQRHNVNMEEWTLPVNQVMPINLQDLLRRAVVNPNMDIQQELHNALQMSSGSLMEPTAA